MGNDNPIHPPAANMKLTTSFLLPLLVGAASAITDASVYIFDAAKRPSTSPPSLSPEQARLVFAQRLGASQYHGIGDASEVTLSYVNRFGGPQESLFQDKTDKVAELVLIVEGVSSETAEPLLKEWSTIEPDFTISHPPSLVANKKLVLDLQKQSGHDSQNCPLDNAINPFDANCWTGRSKAIHFDLASSEGLAKIDELMAAQKRLVQFAQKAEMNVVVVLMGESSRTSKSSSKPYGSYDRPSQVSIGKVRRQAAEEPITEAPVASTPPMFNSKQVQSSNTSKDACQSSTNNCSGHGTCFKKYSTSKADCFTCGCARESFMFGEKKYFKESSWGGSACHKQDVSGPFWLIGLFTVVMVGTISWGIGLMYSIGEEKLPGVIGAGVSSKTR